MAHTSCVNRWGRKGELGKNRAEQMEMSLQGLETCPVKDNFPAYTRCSTIVPSALAMLAIYPSKWQFFGDLPGECPWGYSSVLVR
jgi:hypothetical protein